MQLYNNVVNRDTKETIERALAINIRCNVQSIDVPNSKQRIS